MKIKTVHMFLGLGFALLATICQPALAQTMPGTLAEEVYMTVKDGHQQDFETALRAHAQVRAAHNDPRRWDVYTMVTGDDLNTYIFRACCFAWKDQDAYEAWENANPEVMADWNKNAHPHVEKYAHYFDDMDLANSYWPEDNKPINYLGVMEFFVAAGQRAGLSAARAEISQIALNQGWSAAGHRWAWTDRIGGEAVTALVVPFENYAAMSPGGETFIEFLIDRMGEDAAMELQKKFSAAVSRSQYTILKYRPELGAQPRN